MLLWENKKAKLLNMMKLGINPFKKFVSTGEIKEDVGFVQSRKDTLEKIKKILKDNKNVIIPVIADVGIGKTHLFWALKNKLIFENTVYISLENVFRKFFYNLYSVLIDEIGAEPLRNITNQLCNNWGALEKRFGFFHVIDIEKVRRNAFNEWGEDYKDKFALMDAINAVTAHQLDPYKKIEAERWLLGELMDIKELTRLNLMHDLHKKNNAFTMLKILIENSTLGTVLFIDDFEKIITFMSETEDEEEDVYDPSYFYGTDSETPEKISALKILDKILSLLKIKKLKLIVTLKSVDALEDIKEKIKEKDENILGIIKEPMFLTNFTEDDMFDFYKKSMEIFLKVIDYLEFIDEYEQSCFPLNKSILKHIYTVSKGNPREIIKFLIKLFNEVIYSDDNIEEILEHYKETYY